MRLIPPRLSSSAFANASNVLSLRTRLPSVYESHSSFGGRKRSKKVHRSLDVSRSAYRSLMAIKSQIKDTFARSFTNPKNTNREREREQLQDSRRTQRLFLTYSIGKNSNVISCSPWCQTAITRPGAWPDAFLLEGNFSLFGPRVASARRSDSKAEKQGRSIRTDVFTEIQDGHQRTEHTDTLRIS